MGVKTAHVKVVTTALKQNRYVHFRSFQAEVYVFVLDLEKIFCRWFSPNCFIMPEIDGEESADEEVAGTMNDAENMSEDEEEENGSFSGSEESSTSGMERRRWIRFRSCILCCFKDICIQSL